MASQWTFCRCQETALPLAQGLLQADTLALPVDGLAATVSNNSRVALRWQTTLLPDESFFVIERSLNGVDFNAIGVIKNSTRGVIEFMDDAPIKGKAYYRIKTTSGQEFVYSSIISATLSGDISCRFYPNPVDKALIIRSDGPLEVQIADKFGKPLISSRLPAGLKIVDVSSLEPGVYVITLFQKDSNRLLTEKLVKK